MKLFSKLPANTMPKAPQYVQDNPLYIERASGFAMISGILVILGSLGALLMGISQMGGQNTIFALIGGVIGIMFGWGLYAVGSHHVTHTRNLVARLQRIEDVLEKNNITIEG